MPSRAADSGMSTNRSGRPIAELIAVTWSTVDSAASPVTSYARPSRPRVDDGELAVTGGRVHRALRPDRGGPAARIGLSRSTFAARFAEVVGEPPMRYLAGWRIRHARWLLRGTGYSVAEIGA